MLPIIHLLERRFGVQPASRIAMRLLLASGLLLMLGLGFVLMPGQAIAQVAPDTARATATRLLDHLDRGEFTQAEAMFDANMKAAVPAPRLEQVWKSLPADGSRGESKLRTDGTTQIIVVPMTRGGAKLNATIGLDAEGRVSGLLIQPDAQTAPAPAIATDAAFTEKEVMVGDGERALPATLAVPKGKGPFPAVVLVHGSGPQDRDETIGANRPFLDIARGLAAQGIAVLRYEKRTKARPQDYASGVDIDNETTDDAVTALATLRAQPGIDPDRVFVVGHSQGGMMAPRIAMKDGKTAGLVLLAAPARNLLDILMEQNVRILGMQGIQDTPAGIAHLDSLKKQIANVRGVGDATIGAPMSLPIDYWRSVDAVDPVKEARKADEPMLILHGGHDIQVVDADWQAWQAAFGSDKDVVMKRYPTLNHLAIDSPANAGLESYQTPGHVDATLIADIANWIKATP